MLVRLFGRNFRSLKEEFSLSMVAADLTRREDRTRGTIKVDLAGAAGPLHLLRCAAIYGPNASGKSTVLTAARALNWLVTSSSQWSKPDAIIPPYEPFSLDERSRSAPILLGCDFVVDKRLARYELEFTEDAIQRELLAVFDDEGQEVKIIDRLPTGDVGGELIANSDANRLYVKEMQPNVSVVSKLGQHGPRKGPESVQPYFRAIRNATRHGDYSDSTQRQILLGGGQDRFADDDDYRDWIMEHLIRPADLGIRGVIARREVFNLPDEVREQITKDAGFAIPDTRVVVSFVHEGASSRPIDFNDESAGTRKLFHLGDDWWRLANDPFTLHADELGASLHPRLLERLIRAINEPASRKIKPQLVFATHDTGLQEGHDGQPPALRRDQVYFTRKDETGATELYTLSEFKEDARPVHNIRKRYLSGVYGAIPSVDKMSL